MALQAEIKQAVKMGDSSMLPPQMSDEDARLAGLSQEALLQEYDWYGGQYFRKGPAATGGTSQSQSAQQKAAQQPGHHYVDKDTEKLVGTVIIVRGMRRILRTDKNGRLYYEKPVNRGGKNKKKAPVVQPRADAPSTVLNVVLGS
jgi:hypothetical protein